MPETAYTGIGTQPYEAFATTINNFLQALTFTCHSAEKSQRLAMVRAWADREIMQRVLARDMTSLKALTQAMHTELDAVRAQIVQNDGTVVGKLRHPMFQLLQVEAMFSDMKRKTRAVFFRHLVAIHQALSVCCGLSEIPSDIWEKVTQTTAGLAARGGEVDMNALWQSAIAVTQSITPDQMQAIAQSVSGDKFQSLLSVMGGGNGPGGAMGSAVAQMLAGAMKMGGQQTAQRPAKRLRAKPKVGSVGGGAAKSSEPPARARVRKGAGPEDSSEDSESDDDDDDDSSE